MSIKITTSENRVVNFIKYFIFKRITLLSRSKAIYFDQSVEITSQSSESVKKFVSIYN